MLGRLARWLTAALILAAAAGYVVVRASGHDPARWHVDPAQMRPGVQAAALSNDFFAAGQMRNGVGSIMSFGKFVSPRSVAPSLFNVK